MKEIRQRFMYIFHWAGFVCLATLIVVCVFDVFFDNGGLLDDVIEVLMLAPRGSNDLRDPSAMLWVWLAVTHYPIKWIITGNSSFFPWKS